MNVQKFGEQNEMTSEHYSRLKRFMNTELYRYNVSKSINKLVLVNLF